MEKSWKFSRLFHFLIPMTKTKTFSSRPRPGPRLWVARPGPRLYCLSSRRVGTKTLTTSLIIIIRVFHWNQQTTSSRINAYTPCLKKTTPTLKRYSIETIRIDLVEIWRKCSKDFRIEFACFIFVFNCITGSDGHYTSHCLSTCTRYFQYAVWETITW